MSGERRVIIVGGGVAGISSAVCLAKHGIPVLLLEQRKLLGGRAGSFSHAIGADSLLDTGQHVLLGCCSELQMLYRTIGADHLIRFDDAIHFADVRGERATMRSAALPSPLHLGPSLLGFGMLSLRQRLQIARAMAAMFLAGTRGRDGVESISFAQYLRAHGQSDATIREYWDVICVSALNEPCESASAKYGMQVFQEGFLRERRGYRLGYARVALASLYSGLEKLPGVSVRSGASVSALRVEDGAVKGVTLVGGEELAADSVILATNPGGAIPLLRPFWHRDPQFAGIARLQFRPIIGAHLLYDRPTELSCPVAMMGTKLHWIFPNQRRPELVHGVVSAADALPADGELTRIFDDELRGVFAAFRPARLLDSVIVRESRATFRCLPGVDALRPSQRTAVPGLTLAGDYTKTNWPATMEGAARSGRLAAEIVAEH